MSIESNFNQEAKLLTVLSRQRPDLTSAETLSQQLDYGKFLQLSYAHRVLPLVFHHIESDSNMRFRFPSEVVEIGRIAGQSQKLRTRSLLKHAKNLFSELSNSGRRFMLFRGLLLATTVYQEPHWRNFEDIDLLVEEDGIEPIDRVLKDLGYVQGNFDPRTNSISPYSKQELEFWKQDRQHLGSYLLPTNDPFTAAVKIDVHFKLTNRCDSFEIHSKDLLPFSRQETVLGSPVEAINITDLLIMLCVHVHSHSKWLYEIRDHNDLHLSRLTDIFEVVNKYRSEINWDLLVNRVNKFNINFPVALGLFWAAKVYSQFFPEEVLNALKPDNFSQKEKEIVLRDSPLENKVIGNWQNDFLDRLFDLDRYSKIIKIVGDQYRLSREDRTGLSTYHF